MADRFYTVLDFMVTDLKLKGLERDIYAIIYGFCQAGKTYNGGLQYLADWTLTTKQGVIKVLKKLEEKGLLIKEEKVLNNVKFNEYQTVNPKVNGIKQSLTGGPTQFNGGIKQSLPNNKDIYINNNKNNNKNREIDLKECFDSLEKAFTETEKERMQTAITDLLEVRKAKKVPNTERAIKLLLKKAYDLANGDSEKMVKIFERSTMNGWAGVFELPSEKQGATGQQYCETGANTVDYPF